ncbi:protein SFI1 homolog [Protopterus annectens]|uniref:protein SFI1 homolog n=1 Tax=Protopterus annectens TaxID=7888 RepID=UPI001CFA359D|nr:protein SFI1 homolog [Protopterus annectens]
MKRLREVFAIWQTNAVQLAKETRNVSRADKHYKSVIALKVIKHWRETATMQIYHRHQNNAAVQNARRHLNKIQLQHVFGYWREASHISSSERISMEVAAWHHKRKLLAKSLALWKKFHFSNLRKMLLKYQGEHFLVRRLSRFYFCHWKLKLQEKRNEAEHTAVALWYWSISLQGKVFDAWAGYVLERRRKKERIANAVEVYRSNLLQEGVTQILQHTTDMADFRRKLAAQHQVKTADRLHKVVCHCAMTWKNKALFKEKRATASHCHPAGKTVTFQGILPDDIHFLQRNSVTAEEHTRSVNERQHPWIQPVKCEGLPLTDGHSVDVLLELHTVRQTRLQPRRPDFLIQSLQREGLLHDTDNSSTQPELVKVLPIAPSLEKQSTLEQLEPNIPRGKTQGTGSDSCTVPFHRNVNLGVGESEKRELGHMQQSLYPSLTENERILKSAELPNYRAASTFPNVEETLVSLTPVAWLSSPHASGSPSGIPSLHIPGNTVFKEKLLPPSSFMLPRKDKEKDSVIFLGHQNSDGQHAEASATKLNIQMSKQQGQNQKLISPKDFTMQNRKDNFKPLSGTGYKEEELESEQEEKDDERRHLETELLEIRQELQHYHDNMQTLRSWRKQASILRAWLESRVADAEQCDTVEEGLTKEELQQLEMKIESLSEQMKGKRPHIQQCTDRIKEIRAALSL